MDEPTASLSDREVENLFRVIRELKAQGVGIIYISHRLDELPQIADRVTVLRDGAVVGTRPMAEVDRGRADPHDGRPRAVGGLPEARRCRSATSVLEIRGLGCRRVGRARTST